MPIYTYRCENCGVQFERNQKFTDAPLTVCPECRKKSLRKVYTPVGIVFKGSGFYSTDNRSPSGASRGGSHGESSGSQDEGKPAGESKPAGEGSTAGENKPASDSSSSSGSSASKEDKSS